MFQDLDTVVAARVVLLKVFAGENQAVLLENTHLKCFHALIFHLKLQ